MATVARRSDHTLEEQLYAQPYEFDFHQAIRILSALREGSSFGEGENLKFEPARIRAHISYAVPASDVFALDRSTLPDYPPILTVNFLGIAGIQGPLPQPYMELLSDRLRQKDTAFRDFLDMFNHRLVSEWYRVQKKFVPGLEQVSVDKTDIGRSILDLAGFSHPKLLEHVHLHCRSLVNYAPLFWQRQRSIAGLYQLLSGYFNAGITVKEFYGGWRVPPVEDLSLVGIHKGRYQVLGKSMVLGHRSWDASAGVRLTLQQLSWSKYLKHLPGGSGNDSFRDLMRLYGGLEHILEIRATINAKEIPPSRLGVFLHLGQTSWITRGQGSGFKADPDVLLLHERG